MRPSGAITIAVGVLSPVAITWCAKPEGITMALLLPETGSVLSTEHAAKEATQTRLSETRVQALLETMALLRGKGDDP
jgi:hypothetical protein